MRLTEIEFDDAHPVEGYGPGFFRIAGQVLDAPVIVTPKGARHWGGLEDIAAIEALAAETDVIFLGTGSDIAHVPPALRAAVEAAGAGIESMNSAAACRTYNVLVSEGRRVAAALLGVSGA